MARAASRSRIKGQIDITTLMCFTFGVIFLCVMLGFANFIPNPTPFQFRIFLTVLALAAAGIGAALPGYLEVQRPGVFRAGGALALFVLVIANQTVLKQELVTYEEPSEDPRRVAESFVSLNDSGKVALAWSLLDPATRKLSFSSEEYYQTMYRNFRKPLGEIVSRKEVGTGGAQSPAGRRWACTSISTIGRSSRAIGAAAMKSSRCAPRRT
jgi:hypothetical protein